jgi:hypothetical protein
VLEHNLAVTGLPLDSGLVKIAGDCSCGAWLELVVDPAPKHIVECGPYNMLSWGPPVLVIAAAKNGYPPCPAVDPLCRHYQEELK